MFWKILYILSFLARLRSGVEIEEYESDLSYEVLLSAEYEEDLSQVFDSYESGHSNIMESIEQIDDALLDSSAEDRVSFAGPVKAKGTVSVASTFGYNGPANYPFFSSMSPLWFPPAFFPQYFFPTSLSSLTPHRFSNIPFIEVSPISNNIWANTQENSKMTYAQDDHLEMTPLENSKVLSDGLKNLSVESSTDEILENPVTLLDKDIYDNVKEVHEIDDSKVKEPETVPDNMIFGGYVPASGTVKIAARF